MSSTICAMFWKLFKGTGTQLRGFGGAKAKGFRKNTKTKNKLKRLKVAKEVLMSIGSMVDRLDD